MESRTIHEQRAWLGACASLVRARSMRLTGAFIALCALVACGEGRQASLATPVLSYNGSHPFPAVIGESIALTPAVSGTIGHYSVSPPLPRVPTPRPCMSLMLSVVRNISLLRMQALTTS